MLIRKLKIQIVKLNAIDEEQCILGSSAHETKKSERWSFR